MFNALEALLPHIPARQAESTDAHLYLRRQDADSRRRRSSRTPHDDAAAVPEDSLEVSVEALQLFLQNYRQRLLARQGHLLDDSDQFNEYAQNRINAPSGPAAIAASAYGHAANITQKRRRARLLSAQDQTASWPFDDSEKADLALIDDMLGRLKIVADSGVSMLVIQRADTFLAALDAAIIRF